MAKKQKDEDKKVKGKKGAAGKRGPGRPPKAEGKKAKRGPGRPPKAEGKRGPGRPRKNEEKAAKPVRGIKVRSTPNGAMRVTVIGNVVRELHNVEIAGENKGIVSLVHNVGKARVQTDVPLTNVVLKSGKRVVVAGPQIIAEFIAEAYKVEDGIYTVKTADGEVRINGNTFGVTIEKIIGAAESEATDDEDSDDETDEEEAPKKGSKKAGKKAGKKAKKEEGDLSELEDDDSDDDSDDEDDSDEDDSDEDDSDDDSDEDDSDDDSDDEDDSDDSDDDSDDDEDDSDDSDDEDGDDDGGEWNI